MAVITFVSVSVITDDGMLQLTNNAWLGSKPHKYSTLTFDIKWMCQEIQKAKWSMFVKRNLKLSKCNSFLQRKTNSHSVDEGIKTLILRNWPKLNGKKTENHHMSSNTCKILSKQR